MQDWYRDGIDLRIRAHQEVPGYLMRLVSCCHGQRVVDTDRQTVLRFRQEENTPGKRLGEMLPIPV